MERELEFLDFFGFYEIFSFGRKNSKSEVLGIRDPAFKQNFELSFFAIFMNFYGVQTVGKLGLLILAFIVFWKWHNLYLNEVFDGIEMKTNHNWYFKKPPKIDENPKGKNLKNHKLP